MSSYANTPTGYNLLFRTLKKYSNSFFFDGS